MVLPCTTLDLVSPLLAQRIDVGRVRLRAAPIKNETLKSAR